jgi:hypothetical protein
MNTLPAVIANGGSSLEKAYVPAGSPATNAAESEGDSKLADLTLHELTERVRALHAATRSACATALQFAMDAGDALIEGESRALLYSWKRWVADPDKCRVSLRTSYLYCQLARARQQLEDILRDTPQLSIRGAARLIAVRRRRNGASNGKSRSSTTTLSKPVNPIAVWKTLSLAHKRTILDHEGRAGLAKILSQKAMTELADHVVGLQIAQSSSSLALATQLTCALRAALTAGGDDVAMDALRKMSRKLASNRRGAQDIAVALVRKGQGKGGNR